MQDRFSRSSRPDRRNRFSHTRRRTLVFSHARRRTLAGVAAVLAFPLGLGAQEDAADSSPHSEIALVADVSAVQPGWAFTAALRITLDPGWHTYWVNAGDAGLPLQIQWDLPAGFVASPLEWPVPERIPVPPLMSYGYEDEVLILARITPPAELPVGAALTVRGDADWLVCADVCIPARGEVVMTLPYTTDQARPDERWAPAIEAARDRLPRAAPGWRTRAWAVDSAFVLELQPPAGTSFDAPYLFADSMGIVEHALPHRVVRAGETWRIRVPRSEFAPDDVTRIGGIVVADANAGRESPGWTVEAPIGAMPADVAAEPADAFRLGPVLQTGGLDDAALRPARPIEAGAGMGVLLAVAFAFLGGLILNLMPCVFPVLSIKVLSLVGGAGASASGSRRHALMFAAGVVLSFWALAGALFGLRAAGASLGWGFHLQSPTIVALLALGMFVLALSMSGVFEFGLFLTRLGRGSTGRGDLDALMTGGLAVLIAAPCTAPFMGAALGFALVQPPAVGLAVFTGLALGLAAPYSILAASPSLLRHLPRPGKWMETLKQGLAFPLYATVVWLAWVFGRQAGLNATAVLLFALTIAAFAAWLAGRAGTSRTIGRVAVAGAAVLALATSVWAARAVAEAPLPMAAVGSTSAGNEWEPFSSARLAQLRSEGRPVFVNFTAAWCLSCQVNDRVALRSSSVRDAFAAAEVALLEADWTSRDDRIADLLQSFGRSGVPLYVVYPADPASPPEVLPAMLTPAIVVAAVTRAATVRTAGE